jgi:hypothetical protein
VDGERQVPLFLTTADNTPDKSCFAIVRIATQAPAEEAEV